jgi:tRNA threonylcarbamoyladenosine biosynthesis protein TsaB
MPDDMSEDMDPVILAIETATRAGSVALVRGQEVLAATFGDPAASHSTDLIEMVENSLVNAGAKLSEVDLFGAALGPGSFTGLRIGLATIKSFAICTGRRCAGVSTLAAIAHAAGTSEQTVSLLPAGRGELFAQMFTVLDGQVSELDTASHISLTALLEKYGNQAELKWAGEGAHLNQSALRDWAEGRNILFSDSSLGNPAWSLGARTNQLAISVAGLSLNAYRSGTTVSPDELRAVYVRASDAEINEQWQRQK